MTPAKLFVIDSWPVLEWLQRKSPAGDHFSKFLNREIAAGSKMLISRINWGEIMYMLPKKLKEQDVFHAQVIAQRIPLVRISVDDDLVDAATELKKVVACSYADCFAAALAMRFNAPVVTGDPEFFQLRDRGLADVEWLGA